MQQMKMPLVSQSYQMLAYSYQILLRKGLICNIIESTMRKKETKSLKFEQLSRYHGAMRIRSQCCFDVTSHSYI